jgi:hypothetical protein
MRDTVEAVRTFYEAQTGFIYMPKLDNTNFVP